MNRKHGQSPDVSRGRKASPTYNSWRTMRQRCNNSRTTGYSIYGGRGIRVCDRWDNFLNFLSDMGLRPLGTSLHRINNDGNYTQCNCKWASPKEQIAQQVGKPKPGAGNRTNHPRGPRKLKP